MVPSLKNFALLRYTLGIHEVFDGVPTSVTVNDGKFYIGNLGLFPITPDLSKVMRFNIGACPWPFVFGFGCDDDLQKLRLSGSRPGFTTVVAVDFGKDGLLYALELSAATGYRCPMYDNSGPKATADPS
jgi:hypothetical protein